MTLKEIERKLDKEVNLKPGNSDNYFLFYWFYERIKYGFFRSTKHLKGYMRKRLKQETAGYMFPASVKDAEGLKFMFNLFFGN